MPDFIYRYDTTDYKAQRSDSEEKSLPYSPKIMASTANVADFELVSH